MATERQYQRAVDETRERERERYPQLAGGTRVCIEHKYELKPQDYGCPRCAAEAHARLSARQALEVKVNRLKSWFSRGTSGFFDGLGEMPKWPYARFSNAEWTTSCNPRLVEVLREWDFRSPLAIFAPTRSGKTSGFVARVFQEYGTHLRELGIEPAKAGDPARGSPRKEIFLDENGNVTTTDPAVEYFAYKPPPDFVFTTGYDLVEAAKLRKYGAEHHKLTLAAMKSPLLILDEVHPRHTPFDVLFPVVDVRDRAGLPTAIGVGMPPEEFGKEYGAHLLARLTHRKPMLDIAFDDASGQDEKSAAPASPRGRRRGR